MRYHGTAEVASPPDIEWSSSRPSSYDGQSITDRRSFQASAQAAWSESGSLFRVPIAAWHFRVYANIYVHEFVRGAHLAQHLSRRELKKDEVRDTLAHGADAVLSHKQLTLYILLAAVVVALGVFGWQTYTERQTVKATAGYDDAM